MDGFGIWDLELSGVVRYLDGLKLLWKVLREALSLTLGWQGAKSWKLG